MRIKDKTVTVWEESEDPIVSSGRFASFFRCSQGYCKTISVMSGLASSGPYYYVDQDGEEQVGEETTFYPTSMMPGPRVIDLPAKTPKPVREEVGKAFNLIWTDPSSSINKLRIAVEAITTDHGIPKETPDGKFRSLAERLGDFQNLEVGHYETMLALKDVGNTGSHEGLLKLSDCIDALDLLEDALEDIYGGRKARQDAIRQRFTKPKKDKPPSSTAVPE